MEQEQKVDRKNNKIVIQHGNPCLINEVIAGKSNALGTQINTPISHQATYWYCHWSCPQFFTHKIEQEHKIEGKSNKIL